jgi:hypothetical protein
MTSASIRARLDKVTERLSPGAGLPLVRRVITDSRDPSTWGRVEAAEAGARDAEWTGPVLIIDRRVVYPEART